MIIKLLIEINTKTCEVNTLGELLRNYLFVNDGNEEFYTGDKNYKQYGCYETFEVRKDAKKIERIKIIECLKKYDLFYEEDNHNYYGYSFDYYNINISSIWWWDGDGTLVFILPEGAIINNDCKKDYTWEDLEDWCVNNKNE